jgi:hypothetical protein
MGNAKYISEEMVQIKADKKALELKPVLPVESTLEKALPKALKQLDKEKCSIENTNRCNRELIVLIQPLLVDKSGNFLLKDKSEREKIKTALDFFVKVKAFRMLKEYHVIVVQLLKMNIFWIRDISTWEWDSRNTYKQLKSLIDHLFCAYEVPEFMFQAWTEKNASTKHIDWFLHLATGNTARELHKYPIPITKKMAHEFVQTPFPGYSIDDAVRRSQVLGMGGDSRLADSIMMSRLRHDFSNNDFWASVIQFFIGIPMLNLDEIGTVIDYINEQKFIPKRLVVNGVVVHRPENPGFSMKGRNIATLIRDTHAWHKELRQLRRQAGDAANAERGNVSSYKPDLISKWQRSSIKPFNVIEGKNEKRKIWDLKEITNAADLYDEGKSMRHCVYSYLSSCVKGHCSIFSLRLHGISMATIEVRDFRAVQIRGPHNKRPENKEITIINNWAKAENIEITKYAIAGR